MRKIVYTGTLQARPEDGPTLAGIVPPPPPGYRRGPAELVGTFGSDRPSEWTYTVTDEWVPPAAG